MNPVPFLAFRELYGRLRITSEGLVKDTSGRTSGLPGHPHIPLNDPSIASFLQKELLTTRLNAFGRRLWLVAKQDSSHISSLTHQMVRGRRIVITENPELHLTWIYDVVFIKPLPKYLLSVAFWQFYFSESSPISDERQREALCRAAKGFLRSYSYLIQHKSDFLIATNDALVPKNIRFSDFILFISSCQERIDDRDVSPRYYFGELRLTRLNFWAKFFLGHMTYHKIHGNYGSRFQQYYAPILFAFGAVTTVLSAMQVAIAAYPELQMDKSAIRLVEVSWNFSICALVATVVIIVILILIFCFLVLREVTYALKDLLRKGGRVPLVEQSSAYKA
jgi:hypothetical protein